MSLVSYGDSDCDSDEDYVASDNVNESPNDRNHSDAKVVGGRPLLKLPQPKSVGYDSAVEEKPEAFFKKPVVNGSYVQETKTECSLFPSLPKPKAGGKVKIMIPSLNEVPGCLFTFITFSLTSAFYHVIEN